MTEKVADSSVLYDSSPRTHNHQSERSSPSEAGATRLVAGMLARAAGYWRDREPPRAGRDRKL